MSTRKRRTLIIGGGAIAAAGTTIGSTPASAASFEVTNLNDSGTGSLRQAIIDANAAAGSDVITFQAGLTGTIALTTGQLSISDAVDIQGPGQAIITVSGSNSSRVFYLYAKATTIDVSISGLSIMQGAANIGGGVFNFDERLTLDHVTISDNHTSGDGGGLWADGFNQVLTLRDSILTGNTSLDDGGGVYIEDTGGLALFERTQISGNTAADKGGGIYLYDPDHDVTFLNSTISGNTAGTKGGGVYLYSADAGTTTFDHTTISGNTAAVGGGAYLYKVDLPMLFVDSTISGNHATSNSGGGVFLYVTSSAYLTFAQTTIANNTSNGAGGGGLWLQDGSVQLSGSLIADNTNASTAGNDVGVGASAAIQADFSLVEDPDTVVLAGANNITGVDPQLGTLQNNGGLTETQLPALASGAVNTGDPAFIPPPTDDQRGSPRVVNGIIDIGSVEVVAPPLPDAYVTAEDTPITINAPGVLGNDPNPPSQTATIGIPAVNGIVVLNPDGSFTYTPNPNFNGADSFTYVATGPIGPTGTAMVDIDVTPVNDEPVGSDDTVEAVAGAGPVQIQPLANDTDPDGDPLTITSVTQGSQGTVSFAGNIITYTPAAGASGTDSFTYDVTDGTVTRTVTVHITVAAAPTTTATPTTAATIPPTTAPTTPPSLATPTIAELPATGAGSGSSTGLALGLLGAGVVLTAASRRRKDASHRGPN